MPAGEWMTITSMRRWCELNNITDAAELSLEAQDIRVLALPLAMRSALKGAGVFVQWVSLSPNRGRRYGQSQVSMRPELSTCNWRYDVSSSAPSKTGFVRCGYQ
jgi:hypothetical protein